MSTKQWLAAYFVVYLVVGVGIIKIAGPRGFSEEYLAQHGDEHEHYLEIIKSDDYKLSQERPHLYQADATLAQEIAFVERYEGREVFQTEQARRDRFDILFDVFNFLMVAYLIVHFARRPLARLLDEHIQETRERVEQAEQARKDALQARAEAEAKIAGLQTESAELAQRNAVLIEEETRKFEDFTRLGLHEIDHEAEQRKASEILQAKRRMRQELVDQAVNRLLARYTAEASPERLVQLTDEFTRQLEKRA